MKLLQDIGTALSNGVGSDVGLSVDAKEAKSFRQYLEVGLTYLLA